MENIQNGINNARILDKNKLINEDIIKQLDVNEANKNKIQREGDINLVTNKSFFTKLRTLFSNYKT